MTTAMAILHGGLGGVGRAKVGLGAAPTQANTLAILTWPRQKKAPCLKEKAFTCNGAIRQEPGAPCAGLSDGYREPQSRV